MLRYVAFRDSLSVGLAWAFCLSTPAYAQERSSDFHTFDDLAQGEQHALTSTRDINRLGRQVEGAIRERDLLLSELEAALTDRDKARTGELEFSVKLGVAGVERDQCQVARLDQGDEIARVQRQLEISEAALAEALGSTGSADRTRVNKIIELENEITSLRAVVLERQTDVAREWPLSSTCHPLKKWGDYYLTLEYEDAQAIIESFTEDRSAQNDRNDALETTIYQIQALSAQKDVELALARSEIASLELALAEAQGVISTLKQSSEAMNMPENDEIDGQEVSSEN